MLESIFNHNSLITHSIEALAAITGLLCIKKYKGTAATFFIGILVYLFLVDFLGSYPNYYEVFDFLEPIKKSRFYKNSWWYTLFFDIIAVLLFSIFYLKILKKKLHINVIKYTAIFYLIFSVITIFKNFDLFLSIAFPTLYVLSTVLIITCCVFYFVEIIESNKIIHFYKSIYFYISVAIFIWWFIITPLVFYDKYFVVSDRNFMVLKRCIYIFSNIFMYLTFIIGLIVSKPDKLN